MSDEFDANVLEAVLNFAEEYAAETLAPIEMPALPPGSASFPSSESDAARSELFGPLTGGTVTETVTMVPVPVASQLNNTPTATVQNSSAKKRKAARPRKPQSNPNRVRNELRFELAYLREKAAQLEQELSSLQQKTQKRSDTDVDLEKTPTVLIVPHAGSTQEADAWKGIAARQRKRREGAERENARLRIIVEKQRKVAVDLGNLLRKRVAECLHTRDPRAEESHFNRALEFHADIGEFRELFQHLESAYDEVDTVLAANGLATMEIPTNDVHIREGVDGMYLEFFANKIVPFRLLETAKAAWDHFKGVEKHCGNGGLYEKAAKNLHHPYTILEDFTKEMHSNKSRADMKVKQIVRRYVEPDRDIIVFVSGVSPIEIQHKVIAGMAYHLRGYVVTKPSSASTAGHDLTMLQFCSRISIDKEPGVFYDRGHVRAVIRFLIGNTVGNIRCYQEKIENALVDQVLTRQLQ